VIGDTVQLHAPRNDQFQHGGRRLVEIVVNGRVADSVEVAADGRIHDLEATIFVERSSWIALRQFPQLHTNPVDVIVGGKPIRASRDSALWCAETIRQLWELRHEWIAVPERSEAEETYRKAIARYEQIARESAAR
jgi:hypothetical protein